MTKSRAAALAASMLLLLSTAHAFERPEPKAERQYFRLRRPIQDARPGAHNFVVLDRWVWDATREDQGDIRLYSNSQPLAFVLRREYGSARREFVPAAMLNKVKTPGGTQFVLDVEQDLYDHIDLQLDAKDFVATATVEGSDTLDGEWKKIGSFTLYDFSKEKLGSNLVLRFPTPLTFRYLKVVLPGISSEDVRAAVVANLQESKTRYVDVGQFRPERHGRESVFVWSSPGRMPVERLVFDVPAGKVNFSRAVHVKCDGDWLRNEEISHVRLVRRGRSIETENLSTTISSSRCKEVRVTVDNGDDPPIDGLAIKAQAVESRIYFKPDSSSDLWLYAGDEKLGHQPIYDYAKFFSAAEAEQAAEAKLGEAEKNPEHQPRPDDRPISERYPGLIWAALIAAVLSLGGWAVKGFKNEKKDPNAQA